MKSVKVNYAKKSDLPEEEDIEIKKNEGYEKVTIQSPPRSFLKRLWDVWRLIRGQKYKIEAEVEYNKDSGCYNKDGKPTPRPATITIKKKKD